MHPTLYPAPFTAEGWVFENKFDGFRALVPKSGDKAELISRRGRSLARAFPEVIQAIATLPHDAVLDAELVVSDERGRPEFERLRRRSVMTRPMRIADAARLEPAVLCVFDLLSIDGEDLRSLPLLDRKRRVRGELLNHAVSRRRRAISQVTEVVVPSA
jgi:bifunctional non-homologous end joining protein LigD